MENCMSLDNELCIINDKYEEVVETINLLEHLKYHKSNPITNVDDYINQLKQQKEQLGNERMKVVDLLTQWAISLSD